MFDCRLYISNIDNKDVTENIQLERIPSIGEEMYFDTYTIYKVTRVIYILPTDNYYIQLVENPRK